MNIEQERDRLIKADLYQSISMGEYNINGSFISTHVSSISFDEEKNMKYSDIPVTPISLPNDLGMFQVSFEKDQFNTFVRIPNGATGLYNNLNSLAPVTYEFYEGVENVTKIKHIYTSCYNPSYD